VIVSPEIVAVTPPSTEKILSRPPPLTARRFAPDPSIVVGSFVLVRSSSPFLSWIVWDPIPRLKSIVLGLVVARFACSTAQRSVPGAGLFTGAVSAVLVTVNVASSRRSSSARTPGASRRRFRVEPTFEFDPAQLLRRTHIPLRFMAYLALN
jgi:hypothetical protein